MDAYWVVIAGGVVLALLYGWFTSRQVLAANAGTARMQEISGAVQVGAQAYLNRQYRTIAIVGVVILIILGVTLGLRVAIGFLIGAVLSGAAGYHRHERLGARQCAHRAGARAAASPPGSPSPSRPARSPACWWSGSVCSASAIYYFILRATLPGDDLRPVLEAMVALSFGASLISIFARLGGGIFTKGADVGADLVGKVEAGIPEDDPRNPAVIADNVGDNVGDCAGMAADLFETYAVTIVATMLLAAIFFDGAAARHDDDAAAGDRRGVHRRLGDRHLLRPARPDNGTHEGALQGAGRDRRPVGRRDRRCRSTELIGFDAVCR